MARGEDDTLRAWWAAALDRARAYAQRLDRRSWIKMGLLSLFVIGTNVSFAGHLQDLYTSGVYHRLVIFGMIWGAVILSVILLVWHPSKRVRLGWGAPIVISSFIAGSFVAIVGNPMSFADILMYWAMRADASDALYSFWAGMVPPLLLAICGFTAFYLTPTQWPFAHLRTWRLLPQDRGFGLRIAAAFPILPVLMIILATYGIGGRFTATFPVQYKSLTLLSIALVEAVLHDVPDREAVTIGIAQPPAITHVVVIVDESIAADFIDINHRQGTTPVLLVHQDKIANFGYAASTHNCSDQSNAMLRWGIGPDNFADAFTQPTIWQYARKAGFHTVYIDVQKREGMLQNYMTEKEKTSIDEFIQYNDVPQSEKSRAFVEKDLRAARHIQEMLKRPAPQFIYVVKEGLHFPFEGKYPADESYFDNHMSLLEPIGTDRTRLLNSYKNGVRWAVNKFFEVFLSDTDLSNTLVLYTADHGQNLMDHGLPTHCRAVDPHYTEGLVPLFAMTANPTLLDRFRSGAQKNTHAASHSNIYPTLLSLLGYEPQAIAEHYAPTLFDRITTPQGFASGFVFDQRSEWTWNTFPKEIVPREAAH